MGACCGLSHYNLGSTIAIVIAVALMTVYSCGLRWSLSFLLHWLFHVWICGTSCSLWFWNFLPMYSFPIDWSRNFSRKKNSMTRDVWELQSNRNFEEWCKSLIRVFKSCSQWKNQFVIAKICRFQTRRICTYKPVNTFDQWAKPHALMRWERVWSMDLQYLS